MANRNTDGPSAAPAPAPSPDISPKTISHSGPGSNEINALPSDPSSHASENLKGFDTLFDEHSNKSPKSDGKANAEEPPKPDLDTNASKRQSGETVDPKTINEIFDTFNPPENLNGMATRQGAGRIWDRSTLPPARQRVSVLLPPPVEDDILDVPHFHVNVLPGAEDEFLFGKQGVEEGKENKDRKDDVSEETESSTCSENFEGSRLAAALRRFHLGQLSPKEEKTYNKVEGSVPREDFEEYKEYMELQVNELSGWVHAAASKQWNAVRDLEIYKIKAAREKEKAELAEKPVESIEVPNVPVSTDSGRSKDIPALPDSSESTRISVPTNSGGSTRYTTASQSSSRSTRYTTASPGPSRSLEKRSETAIPIEKIIGRPFQPVRKSEPMRRIGRLRRQMRELTIDLAILRVKTLWLQEDSKRWNEMENSMTETIHQALAIEDVKLVAKCEFYRGVARFKLQDFWGAKDSFMRAVECAEVYTEGEEAYEWYRKTEEAILTSPAYTSTPGTARALNSATVSSWGGWLPWDKMERDDEVNERLEEAEKVRIELAKSASSEKPRSSSSGPNFSTEKQRTPPSGPLPNPDSLSRGSISKKEFSRAPGKDSATESYLLGSMANAGARGRAPIPNGRFKPILPETDTEFSEDSEPERVGRSTTRIAKASQHRPLRISTDRSSRVRVQIAKSTSPKKRHQEDF